MSDLSTLPQFEEGHVPVVGGRIHYVAGGEGDQTIVLLHKLGGWTAEWRWIMPILATRMKTIAVDLTGHGGSTMDSEPPFLTTQEEMAAQLMATLDSLGVRKAVMTGSSMGGCIAAVCAVMWPERVSSVTTVGSALAGATTREELVAARAQAIASGQFDEDDNPLPRPHSYMERVFGMSNPAHMEEQTLSRKAAGRWINPGRSRCGIVRLSCQSAAYYRSVFDAVWRQRELRQLYRSGGRSAQRQPDRSHSRGECFPAPGQARRNGERYNGISWRIRIYRNALTQPTVRQFRRVRLRAREKQTLYRHHMGPHRCFAAR